VASLGHIAVGMAAGRAWPPDPGGPPPDGTGSTVFAISKLYYGDTDRNGTATTIAWAQYGLDLDGLVTSACATNVCTLAPGAGMVAQLDGENGIDNSFGENIIPIIVTTFGSDAPQRGNAALLAGDPTLLIALDGLGANEDASPLSEALYHALPATRRGTGPMCATSTPPPSPAGACRRPSSRSAVT
jgi:hypothetical protein